MSWRLCRTRLAGDHEARRSRHRGAAGRLW
jgi:hypothetical protein